MNAAKRSVAHAGLVGFSVLVVALTGCQTHVVHERTRTVYVPAPPQVVNVPPAPAPQPSPQIIYAPPAPEPQPQPQMVVVSQPEQPPIVVIQSETDFYEPLAVHGRWVVVGSYGRCWIPARVEAGWRPYSNGYWQRTDAGWYWASDEPWGWATYHYGRWDFHAQYGWVWVPQTQWAPAWVSWREGGGYIGWAPLRPSISINVNIGTAAREPAFESRAFVFVEHRRMLEPIRPKTVIVNNTTIINKTVNITKVTVVNKTVINEGPRPEVIERESGRKVQAVPVREFRHREEAKVAARERNIPTGRDRKVESSARTERQSAETKAVVPPATHQAEKPAEVVARPLRSTATPARPTPASTEMERPAREEVKRETVIEKRNTPASPAVKSEQLAPARREVRQGEKPAVAARPTTTPVTTFPARDEKKQATAIERKNTATPSAVKLESQPEVKSEQLVPARREVRAIERPAVTARPTTLPARAETKRETAVKERKTAASPAVGPRPRQEARPETRRETNLPARMEAVPPAAVRKQAAPPSENATDKRLISPRGQSRTVEQDKASTKTNEVSNTNTPPTAVPARPRR